MFANLFGCKNSRHKNYSLIFEAEINKLSGLLGQPADGQTYNNMYDKYVSSSATERIALMTTQLLQLFVNSEFAFDEDVWVNVIGNCIAIVQRATVRGVCRRCGGSPRSRIGKFRAGIR